MSKRLFVGNLPFAFESRDLENLFETFGRVVSVRIVIDRATGKSKGFGFVEMTTEEEGKLALSKLHGKDLGGRPLKVTEATPEQDRPVGGNRFGGSRAGGFRKK